MSWAEDEGIDIGIDEFEEELDDANVSLGFGMKERCKHGYLVGLDGWVRYTCTECDASPTKKRMAQND